jgi:inorganic pyrophosphatase/exopolyphosphatase
MPQLDKKVLKELAAEVVVVEEDLQELMKNQHKPKNKKPQLLLKNDLQIFVFLSLLFIAKDMLRIY